MTNESVMQTRELKHPIILLTGYHGCGKSYAANIVRRNLDIAVNLNRYDFITRQLLHLQDINPQTIDYNQVNNHQVDYHLMTSNVSKDNLNYVKDSIRINNGINDDAILYIITNLFKVDNVTITKFNRLLLEEFYELFNIIYANRKIPDLGAIFNATRLFHDNVLGVVNDQNNKIDIYKYLDTVLESYKTIWEMNGSRIIYYAYSKAEVEYFKEKYHAPVIWLEMDHVIRSNVLGAGDQVEKLDLLLEETYINEMAEIKGLSTAMIMNNFSFDKDIGNKLMYAINFD